MSEIDKWAAEQCGVEIRGCVNPKSCYKTKHYTHGLPADMVWTIQDPRCREIVRERFCIQTEPVTAWNGNCYEFAGWRSYYWEDPDVVPEIETKGKTIAEAEIACITAIYEASKDE